MYSSYITPDKRYQLRIDKYICNRFGLAEFFANHYKKFSIVKDINVLDVGCGALPLGIFLADQYKCKVTAVELNRIACICAKENIKKYNLENRIDIINNNFATFTENYKGEKFDLIVSNPPVNNRVTYADIVKYATNTYDTFDDNSFSYLTNSWHSTDGKDLTDYIFKFGQKHLQKEGRIILVFCTIDCSSPDYIYKKARKNSFSIFKVIHNYISAESIGVESLGINKLLTYMVEFRR